MAKVSEGQPKSKDCSGCLTSAKYERSSSSRWHTGIGKPESRSRLWPFFCEGQGQIFHLPCKAIPNCMTVHDNVAVAVILSDIGYRLLIFLKVWLIGTKVGQGHLNDCVCNDSVRSTNVPNMNAVCKFLCVPEEITENYVKPLWLTSIKSRSYLLYLWAKTPTTHSVRVCLVVSRLSL